MDYFVETILYYFLRAFFIFRQLFHFHENSYTTYKTEWNAQNRKNLSGVKSEGGVVFSMLKRKSVKMWENPDGKEPEIEKVNEWEEKSYKKKSRVIISVCKMQMSLRKVDDDN